MSGDAAYYRKWRSRGGPATERQRERQRLRSRARGRAFLELARRHPDEWRGLFAAALLAAEAETSP